MSCIYKYKGQNYTESEFRDLVRNTIVKSTKQGYTTIRFPKGETAARIEGHETISIILMIKP